jgi:hypothetical protein
MKKGLSHLPKQKQFMVPVLYRLYNHCWVRSQIAMRNLMNARFRYLQVALLVAVVGCANQTAETRKPAGRPVTNQGGQVTLSDRLAAKANSFERVDMDNNSVSIAAAMIDWTFVSNLTQIISSVTTCAAMVLASLVAIYGISSWRREFKGKRRIELAEDTLALFYQARDAITAIRSPMSYGGEGSTRKQAENETENQKQARDRAYVVFERFNKHQEVFNKMLSMRYRFMAEIGKDKSAPFEEIRLIINEIFIAAQILADLWAKRIEHLEANTQEKHYKNIRKYETIFWWGIPEEDEINKRANNAISAIEKTCESIIMGKATKERS